MDCVVTVPPLSLPFSLLRGRPVDLVKPHDGWPADVRTDRCGDGRLPQARQDLHVNIIEQGRGKADRRTRPR